MWGGGACQQAHFPVEGSTARSNKQGVACSPPLGFMGFCQLLVCVLQTYTACCARRTERTGIL